MKKLKFLIRGGRLRGWDEEARPLLEAVDRRLPGCRVRHAFARVPVNRLSLAELPTGRPGDPLLNDVGGEFVEVTVDGVSAVDAHTTISDSLREIGRNDLRVELWEA
jgi:hypothetical protein